MINEKGLRIYRKLLYYYENKISVHVNSIFGYRNGLILDLNKNKLTVVIKDIKEKCDKRKMELNNFFLK